MHRPIESVCAVLNLRNLWPFQPNRLTVSLHYIYVTESCGCLLLFNRKTHAPAAKQQIWRDCRLCFRYCLSRSVHSVGLCGRQLASKGDSTMAHRAVETTWPRFHLPAIDSDEISTGFSTSGFFLLLRMKSDCMTACGKKRIRREKIVNR
jgi:hypothetical protein